MKGESFIILYDFLSKIGSIYKYCEIFYNINDKDFIKELIESGKKPIKNADDVEKYMKLAMKFWEKKKENYNFSIVSISTNK